MTKYSRNNYDLGLGILTTTLVFLLDYIWKKT